MSSPTTINAATEARPSEAGPSQPKNAMDTEEALSAVLKRLLAPHDVNIADEQQALHRALCVALKSQRVRSVIASELLSRSDVERLADDDEEIEEIHEYVPEQVIVDENTLRYMQFVLATPLDEPYYPGATYEDD